MSKVRSGGSVLATVILVALVLSACGSSKSSTSTTGATTGGTNATTGTTTAKATGSTITIGVIVSATGPDASSSKQAGTVGAAWERYINEQVGGINNHPVKVIVQDDGGDPAKAQAAEKALVDQDNVVAIVVGSDNVMPAFDADAIAKKVALISGTANSTDWYTKAGVYPTVTDVLSGLKGQMNVAKTYGKATKFADLYCSEVTACGQANPILKGEADKAGIPFTSVAISSTAASYTAECLQLKNEKVDYAQLNFTSGAAAKLVNDCQAQGYNPTWGSSEQSAGAPYKDLQNFTMYGPAYAFPSVADHPGVKTFRDAMQKYAKDADWAEGSGSFAWGGLEVLHKALATITTGDPTRDTILAAMNSISGEDLGGLLPNKLTFTGQPVGFGKAPCYFVVGMKDGKVTAPTGLTPVCPTA